jgi:hypothetical protein
MRVSPRIAPSIVFQGNGLQFLTRESRPEEFRLGPLAEPDANLSAHPAPIKQTLRSYQEPSVQKEPRVPWPAVVETGSPGSYGL